MTESEFEAMHQRYLDGTSRPGERELIEQWSRQLGAPENLTLPEPERAQVGAAIWHRIEGQVQGNSDAAATTGRVLQHPASFWRQPIMRWAAAVLLLVGALAMLRPRPLAPAAAPSWVQQHNASQQPRVLTLADNSHVTLYPGSTLQYRPGLAGARREVRLKGEAFFKVAKNPARPFLVYTEQLVTTVLGTSFRVKAYLGRPNEVAVQEGRVAVQLRRSADLGATPARPAAEGVLLLPNQQVAYSALAPRPLQKKLVANPIVLAPQAFTFEKQPVANVLQALEKAYGVTILYDKNKLAGCTITVTFYQESLYEKLDVLSQALGASYASIDDARIRFRSNGCAM